MKECIFKCTKDKLDVGKHWDLICLGNPEAKIQSNCSKCNKRMELVGVTWSDTKLYYHCRECKHYQGNIEKSSLAVQTESALQSTDSGIKKNV